MQPTVHVIATTFEGTRAALAAAVPLAKGSDCRLAVLVPLILSDAVEPDIPPESLPAFVQRYEDIVRELGGTADVTVCRCESLDKIVAKMVAAGTPVVVGGPAGHWLTSPEERFVNCLVRAGCQVVFVACGANTTQRRTAA